MAESIMGKGFGEARRAARLRRSAWVLAGVVAMPATVAGLLYAFGIPILAAAFIAGCFLYAWPWTRHWSTRLAIVVSVAVGIVEIAQTLLENHDLFPNLGIGLAFGASAVCAVACAEKVGRVVGSAWQERISR